MFFAAVEVLVWFVDGSVDVHLGGWLDVDVIRNSHIPVSHWGSHSLSPLTINSLTGFAIGYFSF